MGYWADRLARAQEAITKKNTKQIEKQLAKYYSSAMSKVISDFESTYNKLLATIEEGKEPTPADLYKLDKYWKMQGQLRQEVEKLGRKQIAAMSKIFELNFFEVYHSLNIESLKTFTTIDKNAIQQMINSIWVADGKTFSQRVWDNTSRLIETLNEGLLHTVVTGKKTSELKKVLQERFNISYRRADTLVRTELCHIQTQAAQQRYKDYGIQYVEVLVDPDARTCEKCKALIGKKFRIDETPPLPVHPNERCSLVAVIETNNERKEEVMNKKQYELTETEKEQLEKIYSANPELSQTIKSKQYFIAEKAIRSRESTIQQAQDVLDGKWKAEHFLRQEGLVKWNDKKKQFNLPRNQEKAVKDFQDKLQKEVEDYKKQINKMDYDTLHEYIFCEDCGTPIHVDGKKTNAVKRCPECQEKYRKWYKAQKERERRAKKKN